MKARHGKIARLPKEIREQLNRLKVSKGLSKYIKVNKGGRGASPDSVDSAIKPLENERTNGAKPAISVSLSSPKGGEGRGEEALRVHGERLSLTFKGDESPVTKSPHMLITLNHTRFKPDLPWLTIEQKMVSQIS